MKWLEQAPIWVIGLVILIGLTLAHEIALRLARRTKAGRESHAEARGFLVSSALALLGLLMAFTFSAAQDRFRLRQELVIAEANAIGTSYLRVQVLDQPWRDRISRQLLQYAELRVRPVRGANQGEIDSYARNVEALQDAIWANLAQAVRSSTVSGLNVVLLQSVNETFDLAASRRAVREARVPISILRLLLLSALIVAAIVGYAQTAERRHTAVLIGVMLLLTMAFCLILDLDRPMSGTVTVSQAPLQRTVDAIRRSEAAKTAIPAPPLTSAG